MTGKNFLISTKNYLTERATFYFTDRMSELDLDVTDFKDHFRQLAILLFKIQSITKFSEVILLIEADELGQVGIFAEEMDSILEDFLEEFNKK